MLVGLEHFLWGRALVLGWRSRGGSSRKAELKVWTVDLQSPRRFQGLWEIKHFRKSTKRLFYIFTVLTFALIVQKQRWVFTYQQFSAGNLAWIKAVVPNCANNSHCVLRCHALTVKERKEGRKQASFKKNALDESVKSINFIKSPSLSIHLFNMLCDKMGTAHKALLRAEGHCFLREKHRVFVWVSSWNSCFFTEHHTYFREGLTNMVTQPWVFGTCFLLNEWSELVTSRK